jgi:hypothetical protein
MPALRQQPDGRLKVPEEPEARDREEDFHRGGRNVERDRPELTRWKGAYRLPPSHLHRGACVSSAHTTADYLERRS